MPTYRPVHSSLRSFIPCFLFRSEFQGFSKVYSHSVLLAEYMGSLMFLLTQFSDIFNESRYLSFASCLWLGFWLLLKSFWFTYTPSSSLYLSGTIKWIDYTNRKIHRKIHIWNILLYTVRILLVRDKRYFLHLNICTGVHNLWETLVNLLIFTPKSCAISSMLFSVNFRIFGGEKIEVNSHWLMLHGGWHSDNLIYKIYKPLSC